MSISPASRDAAMFNGLRSLASCGGCASKASPDLVAMLATVAAGSGGSNAALLSGLDPYDDAAVYQLDAERALVSTLDFFPPLLDDPADYGAVAAANAVSDVYAMGGEVGLALVISGFPETVPPGMVTAATAAAATIITDCGGQIVGGHSIRCAEPVFGLSVTGFVHPDRIWRKSGAEPGDALVLSKPIGTGLLISEGSADALATALASMSRTNKDAARALSELSLGPSAVTDVTGYGLLGHAVEVAERSEVMIRIKAAQIPLLPGALAAARRGIRTSADANFRAVLADRVMTRRDLPADRAALLYDPQTSGGLLAAVSPDALPQLCEQGFFCIGQIEDGIAGVVVD